jgi:DNA polymerase-3 subunit epsilon
VEIACLEIEDFIPTGRSFHVYIDPCRDVPSTPSGCTVSRGLPDRQAALSIPTLVDAFLDFVGRRPDHRPQRRLRPRLRQPRARRHQPRRRAREPVDRHLALARVRFPGMHNSLDALCKRFKISLSEREKHGALIDAKLLAAVYLELKGGRERRLELRPRPWSTPSVAQPRGLWRAPRPLAFRSTDAEREIHAASSATS